ncbi:hypothetical protein ACIBL6_13945 [Streptomyces sp. NPDC050400]|uniref:hypothetical protein n=1 Tax=Streptomyces sp. NPDC050400 TaxID=3365610 RepID=UPI00379BB0A1
MFDFGIADYRPEWRSGYSAVLESSGVRLRRLISRPLTHAWLVWDLRDDEWFTDCPVLLDFDGEQVEVNHFKFDDLSITWNTISPHKPVRWPGFGLQWRHDMRPDLCALQGQLLQDIELLEWAGDDLARDTVAVSFAFPETSLTIFNALDENGLAIGLPDLRYRRHSLRRSVK